MAERLPSGPVTIVFSDVVGSTDLRTEHGDVAAHRLLRAHEDIVRRCVAAHEGREVKALGDGFMLAFVSVRQALGCAVAIQQASAERNAESPGEEVRVRIGVNTGEVVVENGDLYGQAVNASARIAAAARAGEILVSQIVRQLAGSGSGFAFVDRGEVGLKGFPEPWRLYGVAHQATRPAAGGALGGRTPFVGRQAERVELRRVLAQVQSGTGAFVMIGGEPGVGKTRLAEELARRCEREGFLIYTGHCYEAAGAAPYIPIVEAYEQALARAPSPAAFRAFLGESAPDVARLVPRLRALCPDIPPPVELPAEQERRYLFNSLWDVLERTARTKPTLLVLDDIHWADEPTMLLLQHIAERVAGVRLLVVGLYRDTELDAGRPLSAVFGELTRRRLATRLPLKRLSPDSVRDMLTALSGVEPPQSLVELFYAETEGNPFFTEEVFKHLAEEGRLFDANGQFRADLEVDRLDVPEGVRLVVGARLQRLGEDAVKVLAGAAVIGRVFALEVLRQLEETAEEPLLDRLERAERAGLIVAVPAAGADADEQYMFAHELIRQSVLANLTMARRRRLHSRVADVLEHHHSASLEPHAAAIAQHLLDAGPTADPKRTFRFLLLAGTWAQGTAAFEEASAHLEHAYERVDAAGPVERVELLHRLGTARQALGHSDEAVNAWTLAVAGCEDIGEVELAARICIEGSHALIWAGRFAEGVAFVQRGLDLIGEGPTPMRARLLALQSGAAGWIPDLPFEVGDNLLTEATAIADAIGDPALRGACGVGMAINRMAWMRSRECADAGLEAAALLGAAGDRWSEAAVLGWAAVALGAAGRFSEIPGLAAYGEPLAVRIGNLGAAMQCRRARDLMVGSAAAGNIADLARHGQADVDFCLDNGIPWVDHGRGSVAIAAFLRGDWDTARIVHETAVAAEPPSAINGLNLGLLFEFRAYAEPRERALELLDAVNDRLPVAGQDNHWGRWLVLVTAVEAFFVLGERERAADLYEAAIDCRDRTGSITPHYNDCRLIERTAAIAATAARNYEVAEGHFGTALRQAAELPHVLEQAHTRRFYAVMLLERDGPGDRAEASRLRAEAADLYRRMGMPRHLAMVEDAV